MKGDRVMDDLHPRGVRVIEQGLDVFGRGIGPVRNPADPRGLAPERVGDEQQPVAVRLRTDEDHVLQAGLGKGWFHDVGGRRVW